ncbi:MAG: tetratricopeptide repeat protein, partial [Armatimonadetes bacterium]|nr:tetratricopeptide repeat protein [Armatimonadota bacterium]
MLTRPLLLLVAGLLLALLPALSRAAAQAPATSPDEPPEPAASPAVARLLAEGRQLAAERRFAEGRAAAERALDAARMGQDRAGEATAHRLRAQCLGAEGKAGEAVTEWAAAAGLWALLGNAPARIEALGWQAWLQPGSATALDLLGKAVQAAEAASRRPLAAAGWLNDWGLAFAEAGRLREASLLLHPALLLRSRRAPGSLAEASSLYSVGLLAYLEGDLARARQIQQKALELRERLASPPGAPSLDIARSLNNLALVLWQQGDLAAAQRLVERALAIHEKLVPGSAEMAHSIGNLGNLASERGNLRAARGYQERALALLEGQAPDSLTVARVLNNLGAIARMQGDLMGARRYHERALAIQQRLAPGSLDMATVHLNLGIVALEQEAFSDARNWLGKALLAHRKLAPDSLALAATLTAIGNAAFGAGGLEEAESLYAEALTIQEHRSPDSLAVALSLNNLGGVARARGHLQVAADYYRRALAIQERVAPDSPAVALTLRAAGLVLESQRDLLGAERQFARSWRLVRRQSGSLSGDEARRAYAATYGLYARDLVRIRLRLNRRKDALRALEEGRAQALHQAIQEQHLARAAAPVDRLAHEAAFNAERIAHASYARMLERERRARNALAAAGPADQAERRAAVETAGRELEAALGELTQKRLDRERTWDRVKATAPRGALADALPLARARASLQPREVFLAYSIAEGSTHLFLLTGGPQGDLQTFTLPRAEREWKERVQMLLRAIEGSRPEGEVRQVARDLTRALAPGPALERLRTARRVVVSPDGPLWDVPFAALVLPRRGRGSETYLAACRRKGGGARIAAGGQYNPPGNAPRPGCPAGQPPRAP